MWVWNQIPTVYNNFKCWERSEADVFLDIHLTRKWVKIVELHE